MAAAPRRADQPKVPEAAESTSLAPLLTRPRAPTASVVALAVLDGRELSVVRVATTWYQYFVNAARPVSVKDVTLAPTEATAAKLTPSAEREILKPSSSEELSVQVKPTWLLLSAVAVRLLGAAGRAGVVALAVLDWRELSTPL